MYVFQYRCRSQRPRRPTQCRPTLAGLLIGTPGPHPLADAAALAATLATLQGGGPAPTTTEPIQPDSPSKNTRRVTTADADAFVAQLALPGTPLELLKIFDVARSAELLDG